VFVVGCLGDSESAAAVLFERESVQRDTSTRRKAGKGLAASLEAGVDTVGAICAGTVGETLQDACTGRMISAPAPVVISRYAPNQEVATTLSARDYKGPSCGRDGVTGNPIVTERPNLMPYTGKGFGEWKVGVGTLRASGGDFGGGSETIVAYPLQDGRETMSALVAKGPHAVGLADVSHALTKRHDSSEDGTGRGVPIVAARAVPFYDPSPTLTAKMQGASGWAPYNETAHLVGVPIVAHAQPIAFDVYNSKLTGDVMGVVREQHGTNTNAVLIPQPVAFQENGFRGTMSLDEISYPLTCGGGKPGQGYAAVMIPNAAPTVTTVGTVALRSATTDVEDVSQTLITERACGSCVAFETKAVGVDLYNNTTTGDVHVPLRTAGGHGAPACLEASAPYVVVPTLTASNDPSRSPQSSEVTQQVAAVYAATFDVRRLTPRECERLQGFPDDWTAIPFRGKPASDGPRYKALGNSMAVNCMEWIGERIAAYEASKQA